MVQFLSINFFSWISSIFVGFFKSSFFCVSPCITMPGPMNVKKMSISVTTHCLQKSMQPLLTIGAEMLGGSPVDSLQQTRFKD